MVERHEQNDGGRKGLAPAHPIRVVAARTGLTTHAIRAWENRYGAVDPDRSERGHRLYSDADVERLRLLHELTRQGRRIGDVATLPTETLAELLREDRREAGAPAPGTLREESTDPAPILEEAQRRIRAYDAEGLERLLRRTAFELDVVALVEDVIAPLLHRVGRDWSRGELRPAQEHLASAAMERALTWILEYAAPTEGAPLALITTPSGHRHSLGALLAAAAATGAGWRAVYVGEDLPAEDIAAAVRETGARAVGLSLVFPPGDPSVAEELSRLAELLPEDATFFVGGAAASSYAETLERSGARRLDTLRELRDQLTSLVEAA